MTGSRFCPICEQTTDAHMCPTDRVPTVDAGVVEDKKEEEEDPFVGRVFAERFQIDRVLGQGGFGRVYVATQLSMSRKAALKTLRSELGGDKTQLKRFYHEARAASSLTNPHVVRIYDFGIDDSSKTPFIAMELLRGRELTEVIRDESPLPPRRAARIAQQVAAALIEAADQGIIHRDLKPDNIFLMEQKGQRDFVKVMDFGIAKVIQGDSSLQESLTGTGMTIGTPKYMSPEQALGKTLDPRSDLYSLGCILFEMLTGRLLFDASDSLAALMMRVTDDPPPLPDPLPGGEPLPTALAVLHERLVAREPDGRPSDPEVVAQVLESVSLNEDIDAAAVLDSGGATVAEPATAGFDVHGATVAAVPTDRAVAAAQASTTGSGLAPTMAQTPSAPMPQTVGPTPQAGMPADPSGETNLAGVPVKPEGLPLRGLAIITAVMVAIGVGAAAVLAGGSDSGSGEVSTAPTAATAPTPAAAQATPPAPLLASPPAKPASPKPKPVASSPVPAVAEPAARPAPAPPARKRPCRLVLESTPAGAEVYRGDSYLCETPCNIEVESSDEPVELRLARAGYLDRTVSLLFAEGRRVAEKVKLKRNPVARKAPSQRAPRRTRTDKRPAPKPAADTPPKPAPKKEAPKVPAFRVGTPKDDTKRKSVPKLRIGQ